MKKTGLVRLKSWLVLYKCQRDCEKKSLQLSCHSEPDAVCVRNPMTFSKLFVIDGIPRIATGRYLGMTGAFSKCDSPF